MKIVQIEQLDALQLELQLGTGPEQWWHSCHSTSIAIVRSGIWLGARVARGMAQGVPGQHSWVVVGDPYDLDAPIIDATWWSYQAEPPFEAEPRVRYGTARGLNYRPHGYGVIWEDGYVPQHSGGEDIAPSWLSDGTLSADARNFLHLILPLDVRGWMDLANQPVLGWPSAEILTLMARTPGLAALVPIDHLGMRTDLNPEGLYLPGPERLADGGESDL